MPQPSTETTALNLPSQMFENIHTHVFLNILTKSLSYKFKFHFFLQWKMFACVYFCAAYAYLRPTAARREHQIQRLEGHGCELQCGCQDLEPQLLYRGSQCSQALKISSAPKLYLLLKLYQTIQAIQMRRYLSMKVLRKATLPSVGSWASPSPCCSSP